MLGLVRELVLHPAPGAFEIRRNAAQVPHNLRVAEHPVHGVDVVEGHRPQHQPPGDERELYARTGLAAAEAWRSASR